MENADAAAAEQGCGILRNARTNASIPQVVGRESTSRRFMQTAVYAPPGARHPTETRSNPKMHDWETSTVLPPPRVSWI